MKSSLGLLLILCIISSSLALTEYEIDLIPYTTYAKKFENLRDNVKKPTAQFNGFLMPVKIGFGYNQKTFHLLVDTTFYSMWVQSTNTITKVSDHQVTYLKEETSRSKPLLNDLIFSYKENKCQGDLIQDQIIFQGNSVLLDFPLVMEYSSYLWRIDGVIGLSRFPNEENKAKSFNSFMSSLLLFEKAKKKIFSMHFFNETTPKLLIGKEHENFTKTDQVVSCDALTTINGTWSCSLKEIYHNNTIIPINTEIIFDSSIDRLYFPVSFKDIFKKIFNECEENQAHKGDYYFDCRSLKQLLPFVLSLGNHVLKFPHELLFQKYLSLDRHKINIIFTTKYNQIHFGTQVFKYYHILFDGDNNKIQLYSDNKDNIGLSSDYKKSTNSGLLYCLIGLCLMTLFALTVFITFKIIKIQLKKSSKKRGGIGIFDETEYLQMRTVKH